MLGIIIMTDMDKCKRVGITDITIDSLRSAIDIILLKIKKV